MVEVNLLKSLPQSKRNLKLREVKKTEEHIRISRKYGREYFDGSRDYGYGGYKYDGRWKPVAIDIIKYFNLNKGDKVLDVGCAKGFLVKDLCDLGINASGIDISQYALDNSIEGVRAKLSLANANQLPFPNDTFDAVLSINTIHNLDRNGCISALKEINRVCKSNNSFVQVDSYHTPEQKKIFESWVLTAKFYGYPQEWLEVFLEAEYSGDWYWTIIN